MLAVETPKDFDEWRKTVRSLLAQNITPSKVAWVNRGQQSFFSPIALGETKDRVRVSKEFLDLARLAACHTDSSRWALLHQIVWRLSHGEARLLSLASDPAVRALQLLTRAVSRDIHKMHAFVRFKKITDNQGERFVAWHRPDFHILRLASPFFVRRFGEMNWAILTPVGSVAWDKTRLHYTDESPNGLGRPTDDFEELWRTYYRAVFNPARANRKMMTKEMPRRFWRELPETETINELLKESANRARKMLDEQQPLAKYSLAAKTLPEIQETLHQCRACPLFQTATQVVPGEGPKDASIVIVGEQPGNEEDWSGRPFVGPAGQLLDRALSAAGIERTKLYLTNAVKHFKYELRGKVRLHKRASAEEQRACHQWLEAELSALKPKIIIALGRTAAQALLGRVVPIETDRGKLHQSIYGPVYVSYHPSALLRSVEPERKTELFALLVEDLRKAKSFITAE